MIIIFNVLLILCMSFFSVQANADNEQFVKSLVCTDGSVYHRSSRYEEFASVKDKKPDFYVSANGGKIRYDNSEIFVKGIKAIGQRFIDLINTDVGTDVGTDSDGPIGLPKQGIEQISLMYVKEVLKGEIESINQINSINFQWLGSVSLGYYAGENGQIDFEAMCSKVNIENSKTPTFDKSAGIFAFLLNFYYNPHIQDTKLASYISVGVGPTVLRLRKINGSPQNLMPLNVPWFAYQIKFGVDYSIIPEVKTFLGYRYFSIPLPIADDISTHNIEIGLIFNF